MNSQESLPVHYPPQFQLPHHPQQQHAPPHGHGTMVAPPPPPPSQPHHQEQPNSYILPTNTIFQQPQQQNLDHSNGSSTAAKKKRGRPRKYTADGNNLSPTPITQIPLMVNHADSCGAKRARGRPPGSGKKQKKEALGTVGLGFTPHLIPVHIGEDIVSKVMTFSLQGPPAICILSATGAVGNVTLRQSTIGGGTVTYEDQFNIISLSGSFLLSESNGNRSRTGGLSVSLSAPDGRVLGGVVAGMLKAATPVQLIVGSFIPEKEKPMSEAPSSTPPPNMLNFGAPVTEASSPSPGASTDSADENGGIPLSYERGPFGNAAQQMHPNAAQPMHPNAAQPMHGMPTYWGQAM